MIQSSRANFGGWAEEMSPFVDSSAEGPLPPRAAAFFAFEIVPTIVDPVFAEDAPSEWQ